MDTDITIAELEEIAEYTALKIARYPKEYGKTLDNSFDVLFPNEIRDYIMRREINRRGRENYERRERRRNAHSNLMEATAAIHNGGGA
jgi:hypothetical protein